MMQCSVMFKSVSVNYFVYGKGFPVLLLHGFAETSSIWKKQIKYLSSFYKLIVPDLPGSGQSKMLQLENSLTIDILADAVYSIIKKENIDKCIMLGHSMGGYTILAFAEKHADKLAAFGFVQSTAFADSEEKKQNRLKAIKVINEYGGYNFLKTSLPGLFSAATKKKHAVLINSYVEEGKNFTNENLKQYYYAMMNRPDRTSVIKNSNLPVLFVMGTEDNAAPVNDVLQQVHLAKIAYIHIIKNSGHMSMLERPLKLNRILKNFVDECA